MAKFYNWTCNECKRHGSQTFSAARFGGGSYRRGGSMYYSDICRWCNKEMQDILDERPDHHRGGLVYQYDSVRVQNTTGKIKEIRDTMTDFEYGVMEAEAYFSDYVRFSEVMRERVASETEEYQRGFHSVNPAVTQK